MKNNTAKQNAESFQKQFSVYSVTYPALKEAVETQGYTVVEFSHICNEKAVACLIDALNISDAVLRSKGFTYADCDHRVVFIHEDLSDDEKLMILAHEEGHIFCRHMNTSPIIGQDVQDEYEANEFAHYLLNPGCCSKIKSTFHRHKKLILALIIALALLSAAISTLYYTHEKQSYYGEYYITESGSKYHKKDCIFVKDKTNIHRMSNYEFESGEYEPCRICLP
ncbi:unknown [Ruminococcus sp. CAG:488]|nr:unknown [Ruminococcus sp. CAG:488]